MNNRLQEFIEILNSVDKKELTIEEIKLISNIESFQKEIHKICQVPSMYNSNGFYSSKILKNFYAGRKLFGLNNNKIILGSINVDYNDYEITCEVHFYRNNKYEVNGHYIFLDENTLLKEYDNISFLSVKSKNDIKKYEDLYSKINKILKLKELESEKKRYENYLNNVNIEIENINRIKNVKKNGF